MLKQGVSYVPGDYQGAVFVHGNTTDEMFAKAVDDLKKTRIKNVSLQHTKLTDQSIGELLELKRLETLYVNGTAFTAAGLTRLSALPRLKQLYVAEGQFTEEEQARIRAALPTVELHPSPMGAWRFERGSHPENEDALGESPP